MVKDRRKPSANRRLVSWKEIAAYFGRDERTVKRWEKDRGLPVRRLPGARGGVYAFTDDLAQWMDQPDQHESDSGDLLFRDDQVTKPDHLELTSPDMGEASVASEAASQSLPRPTLTQKLRFSWVTLAALVAAGAVVLLMSQQRMLLAALGIQKPAETRVAETRHTRSAVAQDLYLQGRYYWNKRTAADLTKALGYFQQSVASDPNYALAYVGLADCYNLLREYSAMPEKEAYEKAIAAARKAVELDPSLADAHNSLAFDLFFGTLDKKDAEHEFRVALSLNPNCELAHHWYATYLVTVGRSAEALEQIEIARELNSSSRSILADKGVILYYAGRTGEATALLRQLEETEPSFISPHRYLALIKLTEGNYSEYLVEAKKVAVLSKNETDLAIVDAAAKGFQHGGASAMLTAMLDEQQKAFAKGHFSAYRVAETYSLLGQRQKALEYLDTSYERRETDLALMLIDPLLGSLRNDPSYHELAMHAGLS
jgi:tetratricopeptide (TPR) repeat protein